MTKSKCKYVGVDGCKAGWFSVGLDDDDGYEVKLIAEFCDLLKHYANASLVLVDVPIGLYADSQSIKRACDTKARKHLAKSGGSTGSVFPAPNRKLAHAVMNGKVKYVKGQVVYADGGKAVKSEWGKGVNSQTISIAPATAEVDEVMTGPNGHRLINVREVHPEICFRKLSDECTLPNKKTSQGESERISILKCFEKGAERIIGEAYTKFRWKSVARDDIIDALAAAVTARLCCKYPSIERRLTGDCKKDREDCHGLPMEMVYISKKDLDKK